ncbi:MAG: ABC transporter ATP-binding protein [Treponema sp.]|jgi:energy-coupling factor transport system ATP-binding protein|nr:ABC transporter ATP-binding protein [Treponema sp.]
MIRFDKLSYAYKDGGGVRGINLTIHKGELVVLTGKSGCGKTTIIRLINGLAYHFYEGRYEGGLTIDGKETTDGRNNAGNRDTADDRNAADKRDAADMPLWETGRRVGSVFQNPRDGFFAKYAEGEVAFACENYGFPRDEIRRRVEDAIETLHIAHLRDKKLKNLSGGEKQKIAIASVYAAGPDIYVFDEPSSNLDTVSTATLGGILETLKKQGATIIVAEHRINYLSGLADRFVYLEEGEIKKIFSRRELFEADRADLADMGLRDRDFCAPCIQKREEPGPARVTLELAGLAAAYRKKKVFEGFSIRLRSGDILAVTGTNGAGKTSLCRILCGLQKPAAGEIRFNGKKISPSGRMRRSYYVMNGPDNQLFAMSVYEELLLGLHDSPENRSRAECFLVDFGLAELAGLHPLRLSGGQKQRLTLAVAMMRDRELIILDEPTSGLDLVNMELVAKAVKTAADQGRIIIIVSHDTEFINRTCNCGIELCRPLY